eukprot:6188060-Pleurochrysis_carterae.AAC.5
MCDVVQVNLEHSIYHLTILQPHCRARKASCRHQMCCRRPKVRCSSKRQPAHLLCKGPQLRCGSKVPPALLKKGSRSRARRPRRPRFMNRLERPENPSDSKRFYCIKRTLALPLLKVCCIGGVVLAVDAKKT